MRIILANGTELNPLIVTGGTRFVASTNRDTLDFIFPAETSLDELDKIFTAENCEHIKIYDVETEHEYIYVGYTIRAELKRTPMVVKHGTIDSEPIYEDRVTVSMSLRTYMEDQFATTQGAMNALLGE